MDNDTAQKVYRFFTEVGILNQLSRALVEARLPHGLTNTHFGILGHLLRRPDGETPLQLATAFQQPKTTMTHMLKVLVRHNLIEIAPNAADGRSKLARITLAGEHLVGQTLGALAPDMARIATPEVAAAILAALPHLEVVREAMDKARD